MNRIAIPSDLPPAVARVLIPRTLGRPVFPARTPGYWAWLCVGATNGCQERSHAGGWDQPRVHQAEALEPFQGERGRIEDRFRAWGERRRAR